MENDEHQAKGERHLICGLEDNYDFAFCLFYIFVGYLPNFP